MKTAHDIILKPVITENSMAGIADKKYTFKVATDATKVEIAQAVEVLFPGAKVAKVNTVSVRGRFRRQGMHAGYTAASKKEDRLYNVAIENYRAAYQILKGKDEQTYPMRGIASGSVTI